MFPARLRESVISGIVMALDSAKRSKTRDLYEGHSLLQRCRFGFFKIQIIADVPNHFLRPGCSTFWKGCNINVIISHFKILNLFYIRCKTSWKYCCMWHYFDKTIFEGRLIFFKLLVRCIVYLFYPNSSRKHFIFTLNFHFL